MPGGGAASAPGRDASAIPASTAPPDEPALVEDDPLADPALPDPAPTDVEPPALPRDPDPRPLLAPPEPVVLPTGPDVPPPSRYTISTVGKSSDERPPQATTPRESAKAKEERMGFAPGRYR
jgi:hypothetical protein